MFGFGPTARLLLENLEYSHRQLNDFKNIGDIGDIVILAGYAEHDPEIPLSSQVNDASLFRLMEAKRIYSKLENSKIIITGYNPVPHLMREVLVLTGVSEEDIEIEINSKNTYESAVNIKRILRNRKIVLVTSAGHMIRAMGVFKKQGFDPVPAPTDFIIKKNSTNINYFPIPRNLHYSDLAVHEYLAILWYKFKNRM